MWIIRVTAFLQKSKNAVTAREHVEHQSNKFKSHLIKSLYRDCKRLTITPVFAVLVNMRY